jgi:hypothetical protein
MGVQEAATSRFFRAPALDFQRLLPTRTDSP